MQRRTGNWPERLAMKWLNLIDDGLSNFERVLESADP